MHRYHLELNWEASGAGASLCRQNVKSDGQQGFKDGPSLHRDPAL